MELEMRYGNETIVSGVKDGLQRLGYLFYAIDPKDSTFLDVKDVPNYVDLAIPVFVTGMIIELSYKMLRVMRKRTPHEVNHADTVTSLYAGLLQEVFRAATRGFTTTVYIWLYNNYRLVDLPIDSMFTWLLGALSLDFFYYWFHRANHEINVLWAAHQVHHSSEEYNLSTALRQSITQNIPIILVYFPMAAYLPPTHFVVHYQLNLLYQFWIHTEEVTSIGFLEHVLMTPSHHRVHHGANRYCIDKNYGACLIIWDKAFGTFAAENDRVVYGLTHPVASYNPWTVQGGHYAHIWNKIKAMPTLMDKVWAVLKGPGWHPGTARLGDPNELPDHKFPMKKYRRPLSALTALYLIFQTAATTVNLQHYYYSLKSNITNGEQQDCPSTCGCSWTGFPPWSPLNDCGVNGFHARTLCWWPI
ncbi:unnamed protein product, partial [Notodromas monacha]